VKRPAFNSGLGERMYSIRHGAYNVSMRRV
jgi:hypothetical protein